MADDFEYFAEFLEAPAAPDINEFFRMVRRWAKYIEAHKGEFNYLEDDEWKEIRERLLAVLEIRVDEKDALWEEFEEMTNEELDHDVLSDAEIVEICRQRLEFMKSYQTLFQFPDEDIAELEKKFAEFVRSVEVARIKKIEARFARLELDKSIADLDEEMIKHYEKTGKIPMLPVYMKSKNRQGN